MDSRYFPGRGIMYSLLVHELVLFGVFAVSALSTPKAKPQPPELVGMIDVRKHRDVIYFPAISPNSRPVANSTGFSYPGPQTIVSDVPEPTNRILTVLQPTIPNPPILKPPMLLPNIVQLSPASALPRLENPLMIVKAPPAPALPAAVIKTSPSPPVEEQQLVVPEVRVPVAPLKTADVPLLALSPIPATRVQPVEVPTGEARGRFAISPEPNLAANDPEPGIASLPTVPSTSARAENKSEPFSGITILGGPASNASVARDNSSIITIPSGDSRTANSGSGIVSLGQSPPPVTGSYGLTIVSTESSGGGLPNFGVFSEETKYTVYLDMKTAANDAAQSWTLEFGVPREGNSNRSNGDQQGFVLPFPVVKQRPVLPTELVQRYLRRLVIVYGIISADGKIQQMAVKDSPDVGLNEPVLNALNKWIFRPAQLDGQAVPVKVLIGIPLSLP
jgi:TonB-like protein